MFVANSLEDLYRQTHPGVIRIYDANIDAFRDADQADLDLALQAAKFGCDVREFANKKHDEYKTIASRVLTSRAASNVDHADRYPFAVK